MSQDTKVKATVEMIESIESNIFNSYSGNIGCMCGCNGTYKYKSTHAEAAGKNRGYSVDSDEISDTAVKRKISSLKRLIKAGETVWMDTWSKEGIVYHETDTRMNAAYFFV